MVGFAEVVSVLMVAALTSVLVADASVGRAAVVWHSIVTVVALLVRVIVVTEYVRATEEALEWRSLLRSYRVSWSKIVEVRERKVRFMLAQSGVDCIEVEFVNGGTRRLRASVGCSRQARAEFILLTTARLHPQP